MRRFGGLARGLLRQSCSFQSGLGPPGGSAVAVIFNEMTEADGSVRPPYGELSRWLADIPPDVVTMNSRLRLLDLDSGKEMLFTLVFPSDADSDQGRISILAPLGTAVLGFRRGDTFEWRMPGRVRRLRVEEVLYQPEAAGDYHL